MRIVNEFRRITGYKTNTEKSVIFIYMCNGHMDTKIKSKYHLEFLRKVKHSDEKLIKHIQGLYLKS